MKKLLVSVFLSVFLFTSLAYAGPHTYLDVPTNSEFFYPIDYLRRNDVFKNSPNFRPDTIISKVEFIKYLVTLNSPDFKKTGNIDLPYADTNNVAWYAPYLKEGLKLGIISDDVKNIEPYEKLTLIDALTLLFKSQGMPIPKVYKNDIPYSDVKRNKVAGPLIMRAIDLELIKPIRHDYAGIYRRVTRAVAANMIYRMDVVAADSVTTSTISKSYDSELEKIINTWDLIFSSYVNKDEINKKELAEAAIRAMVEALDDPYSSYLDRQANIAFTDEFDGQIEGIGAFIGLNDDKELVVISPIEGSPAKAAGIKGGDVILKVDGVEITGMDLFQAVALIKGPKGTKVQLTIRRGDRTIIKDVIRDVIVIESLQYEVLGNGNVMVVKITQFNQTGPSDFREVAEIMQKNSQIKGLIIDLRNNPGGLLDSAIGILQYLLRPDSEVVTIQYNYFSYTQYNKGKGELADYPIVVLINAGSASASEIVAGALQDYGLAKIIGETSFGKGSVQEINYFIDDSSLKLTVAKWLTPLNNDISENGITPDLMIPDDEATERDEQLDRALIEVRKMF